MRQMENLRSSVYEVVLERLNRIFSDLIMCMFLFREEKIAVCFLIYVSIIFARIN